jgi:transformation/transcription domain-associated protein
MWVMYVQVNDANTMVGTPGELLSRRCVTLLKTALKPDVWPQQCDLKLNWFDKVFASVESGSPNYGNICTALELLTFLLGVMKKEQILASCKPLQRGIAACITCSNSKVQDMASLRRGEDRTHCCPPVTLHRVAARAVPIPETYCPG